MLEQLRIFLTSITNAGLLAAAFHRAGIRIDTFMETFPQPLVEY
jgi:hypothetical protein